MRTLPGRMAANAAAASLRVRSDVPKRVHRAADVHQDGGQAENGTMSAMLAHNASSSAGSSCGHARAAAI